MDSLKIFLVLSFFILLVPSTIYGNDHDDESTNYLSAIKQELARLNLQANCDDNSSSCTFFYQQTPSRPSFNTSVKYSHPTSTIYIYIENYLLLKATNGPSQTLGRRLLELNGQMVTSKFEWNKTANTICISASLNTDSNFDRKAFRSQLLGLLSNADTLIGELSTLATNDK